MPSPPPAMPALLAAGGNPSSSRTGGCTMQPPADCNGHGTLVPADCTCACDAGYANDLVTVSALRVWVPQPDAASNTFVPLTPCPCTCALACRSWAEPPGAKVVRGCQRHTRRPAIAGASRVACTWQVACAAWRARRQHRRVRPGLRTCACTSRTHLLAAAPSRERNRNRAARRH